MKRTVVLLGLLALLAPAVGRAGDEAAGSSDRATTVKSSKSNSQDRMGGAAGERPTSAPAADERGKSVKGSKSNTSE